MTAPALSPLVVESVAFWAPMLPSWAAARAAFRGEVAGAGTGAVGGAGTGAVGGAVGGAGTGAVGGAGTGAVGGAVGGEVGGEVGAGAAGVARPAAAPQAPATRPQPELLAPAERRRAPDSVVLALEVALRAVRESGRDATTLPSIFTSAHGDLAVNDYMCSTLAKTPALISPTRFHNSVHNAAAGYWTIATGCMAASTALSAFDASFAAGLLEAATQVAADRSPVLLVAFDVQATGALASVTRSEGLLACAFVLSAAGPDDGTPLAAFDAQLVAGATSPVVASSDAARALAGNGMADALPFLEALAIGDGRSLDLPLGPSLSLRLVPRARSA